MIKDLFETHINVRDLDMAIEFYKSLPGLSLAYIEEKRRIAFFWIGKQGRSMIGLWEHKEEPIETRHFAFQCDEGFIINESWSFLESLNIAPYNFLNNDLKEPMVFCWMPAVSIYFKDPDNNELEFISMIEGKPDPQGGVVSYEQWKQKSVC